MNFQTCLLPKMILAKIFHKKSTHLDHSYLKYSLTKIFFQFSEAAHPGKGGGCFSANSTVMTSEGERKRLRDLQIGDSVLAVNSAGQFEFSPVILFLDRDPEEIRQFFKIRTESGQTLEVTPNHLIYASPEKLAEAADFEALYAKDIREGDFVLVHLRGQLEAVRVTDIEMRVLTGVYAPMTSAGNLVVDNVVVSCYALIDSQAVAHAAFAPLRWWSYLSSAASEAENEVSTEGAAESVKGIHWYANALYEVAKVVWPRHLYNENEP